MLKRIAFNRNELSGAFGDIGTDLPLIIGMLYATNLQVSNTLIIFGFLQILTSLIYGMPMPVQPLKAVALIVITQNIPAEIIWGGGLAIGVIMLVLAATGLLALLSKIIPKVVIRGIQFGLGLQLCLLAVKDYVPSDGITGYVFAFIGLIIGLILLGNKKYPPAIFIILTGFLYIFLFKLSLIQNLSIHISLPEFALPQHQWQNILVGFMILALPQIPLSLGNSVFATNQLAQDLFPEKKINVQKIGFTYSFMNCTSAVLGGIPVCHGSGGIAGHYAFGGRTGGSTFIYGLFYLLLGLFFSTNSVEMLAIFPKPILGVILLFEGIALIVLVRDIITDKKHFFIAIFVAMCAMGLKNGYIIGMVLGTAIYYLLDKVFLKKYE